MVVAMRSLVSRVLFFSDTGRPTVLQFPVSYVLRVHGVDYQFAASGALEVSGS